MKVVRAQRAGFCMGVDLALCKLNDLIGSGEEPDAIFILGSIIHNPQVIREYAEKGIVTVAAPEEIPTGSTVVIRAHGIAKEIQDELSSRGVHVVDATCPKVAAACLLIKRHTAEGRILLLYGEEAHPEVKCLLSYAAGEAIVFDSKQKCEALQLDPARKYCLAAQTTQDKDVFRSIIATLEVRPELDVTILQTICDATRQRQEEAIRIAGRVDFVIVAGGYESSNTRRLAQVVKNHGTRVLHVETADELPLDELRQYEVIGLTAGASTPKEVVDEIQRVLTSLQEEEH
ncbi:MAG TPA: 4-hydroxy-3-methylbut-2-enyl diphosphate reductase [Desulfuromonadales bacterium]|nr:4-hydroxy-3-methylbut-2-enyl diphosphate reductase [Desulfuromonadales bacterium]